MSSTLSNTETVSYARCIEASKRVRWDIEADVIKGRRFLDTGKYLPDGLTLPSTFASLTNKERQFVSRIQGRTYANIFGVVERFINAKVLQLSSDYWLGDQVKLEALVRFSDEELKHQALFRRVEIMMAEAMPLGYRLTADADDVARAVLGKGTWAILALTLHIELFTQLHYRQSIKLDADLSPIFRDVFLFHWKEERQHALIDELEWRRHHVELTPNARDDGVNEFIELIAAVDHLLRSQAEADTGYFAANCGRAVGTPERVTIEDGFLRAYRWQYILSGAAHPHFQEVMAGMVTEAQGMRIGAALANLK